MLPPTRPALPCPAQPRPPPAPVLTVAPANPSRLLCCDCVCGAHSTRVARRSAALPLCPPPRLPRTRSYIKKYMGAPTGVDIDALKAENERLKAENKQLTATLEDLNQRVLEEDA